MKGRCGGQPTLAVGDLPTFLFNQAKGTLRDICAFPEITSIKRVCRFTLPCRTHAQNGIACEKLGLICI